MHSGSTRLAHAAPARFSGAVIAALALGAGLGGCLRPDVEKSVGFDLAAHSAWAAKGTASVRGEGFLRRPNGWLARCSGGYVFLLPASPYFREWVEIHKKGGRVANATALDDVHAGAIRKTQCDGKGKFSFDDLPAARWLVLTRIGYQGTGWNADYILFAEIETKAGETAEPILSNPNRI